TPRSDKGGRSRFRMFPAKAVHGKLHPVGKRLCYRLLKRGAEIGNVAVPERGTLQRSLAERRLQPGKGKIRTAFAFHRAGKRNCPAVASSRRTLHGGSSGGRQAEQLRRLVKGFAQRVIHGGGISPILPDAF